MGRQLQKAGGEEMMSGFKQWQYEGGSKEGGRGRFRTHPLENGWNTACRPDTCGESLERNGTLENTSI